MRRLGPYTGEPAGINESLDLRPPGVEVRDVHRHHEVFGPSLDIEALQQASGRASSVVADIRIVIGCVESERFIEAPGLPKKRGQIFDFDILSFINIKMSNLKI